MTLMMDQGILGIYVLQSTRMINFTFGSLFRANETHSLAQCVSSDTDVGMFRGIIIRFMELYPELQVLRSGNFTVGTVVPVKVRDRYTYNLITKNRFWGTPTCLEQLLLLRD